MFLTAPETKGKTLEEMDDVFNSGRPPWRAGPRGSRMDRLEREIEEGNLKVIGQRRAAEKEAAWEHVAHRIIR